ncbi:MAG: ABC transporter transmembrane domain-containing protein [Candidatus Poribacteria bacterium]|nr:ABC transporter transmembrane domain-containing protein [Candidatus Poribacteria bacterium]
MMKLIEPMPHTFKEKIRGILPPEEVELICASTDLRRDGNFGTGWLVVTNKQIVLLSPGDTNGIVRVPVEEIVSARTEPLVGGGRLEIERKADATVVIPYSNSLAEKFSEIARGIEQLRKGEPFLINPQLDRIRCKKCGRLLPEKNGICPACIRRLATLRRIGSYLMPYKWRAILLAVVSLIGTFAELIPPMITRHIVDDVLVLKEGATSSMAERLTLLGLLVLGMVGIRLVRWGAEWPHGWIVSWLGARVTADIRSRLYRQLELLSLQFYDKRQVGAVMSRVTRDAGRLQEFLVDGLPYLVINGLMVIGILGFLFWMNWMLTLFILIPVPLMIAWGVFFWRRMRRYFNKWDQAWSDLMAVVNEALSGIRVVKAFAQEVREMAAFNKRNKKLQRISIRTEINWEIFFATSSLVTSLGIMIVWLFGGLEVMGGDLTLGTLLAFYAYMWLVYGPMEWFGEVNSWMTRAFAGAERIFEVIDTPPEAYNDADAIAMTDIEGRAAFKAVTFGYDKSKPVLHEINLDVAPGEMIGLVGKSGVGKTTMVNLICRFYEVDHGTIEIDGVDIQKIRLEDLRSQIGIVPQEPFLFSGTIAENISYGRPGASFEEIMQAAQAATAHNFIVAKPDGYDTQVGERGGNLSGGEKQRVAIARAILHDPKILILDEATSSVDVETEKQIQEAIAHLTKGRTTFAIAHRLSTLRNADRLLVLEGGRVVETGTHRELMEKKGIFYDLVQLQQQTSEMIAVRE